VAAVNEFQMTSVPDVYCCGESTGIGGVDLSLAEGQVAGHAAVGDSRLATRLYAGRKKAKRFAQTMEKAFKLRDELRALPSEDTFICRCEDVEFKRIAQMRSWRSAKLQTRCGMGPCQGRVCGPAIEFLFGWSPASVRPPVFPVSVRTLIENMNVEETATK
jgi:aspartate oxidase